MHVKDTFKIISIIQVLLMMTDADASRSGDGYNENRALSK